MPNQQEENDRQATIARAMRLRQMMNEAIRNLSPQERDRRMQVFLAQARGPRKNAELLRMLTNSMVKIRAAQGKSKKTDG